MTNQPAALLTSLYGYADFTNACRREQWIHRRSVYLTAINHNQTPKAPPLLIVNATRL